MGTKEEKAAAKEKRARGGIRIDLDAMDWLMEEQNRLRRIEGQKPTYSEIIRRMTHAYHQLHPDSVLMDSDQSSTTQQSKPEIHTGNSEELHNFQLDGNMGFSTKSASWDTLLSMILAEDNPARNAFVHGFKLMVESLPRVTTKGGSEKLQKNIGTSNPEVDQLLEGADSAIRQARRVEDQADGLARQTERNLGAARKDEDTGNGVASAAEPDHRSDFQANPSRKRA